MQEKLEQLKSILAEWYDLRAASALLSWDQEVYMPEGGTRSRGQQSATLDRLAHIRLTSDETGRLLEELKPYAEQLEPDSNEARLVTVTSRLFDKKTRVPADLVAEIAKITTEAYQVWTQAKANNDFARFRPYLEKIVDLRRQYASLFAPYDHIYDALLDDYEPGMKTADVLAIFNSIRPQQVELIKAISEKPQIQDAMLYQSFDPSKQWDFGVQAITSIGYDWTHGRQDKAPHPFTIHFGNDDVRITTRVDPGFFNTAFFATLHETGHALYEQGSAEELERSPLAGGASLGIHESQSRMWENLVGRSLPFWEHFYPGLQQSFPSQLGNVDLMSFYKAINKVEPSLIRVEADEATYNLHIMLRLEIEIGLMEGHLDVKDLPEIWNTCMQDYLGITPPDDSKGVLQDVHWSTGIIGYFATYALGNIISVQFWERIKQDLPDLEGQIRRGEFSHLLDWTRQHIHRHGSKYKPQELVQRVTGAKIDPAPYIRYLQDKFTQIYAL